LVINTLTAFDVGEQFSYVCDLSFSTRDETTTQCQADFTWSLDNTPNPVCLRSKFFKQPWKKYIKYFCLV